MLRQRSHVYRKCLLLNDTSKDVNIREDRNTETHKKMQTILAKKKVFDELSVKNFSNPILKISFILNF